MVLIEQIAKAFGPQPRLLSGEETFRDGQWQFSVSPWQKPDATVLQNLLAQIPSRDAIQLTASVDGGDPISFNPGGEMGLKQFLDDLGIYQALESGQNTIEITSQISKSVQDDALSVYSFTHLADCLTRLNSKQLFAAFEPLCSERSCRCILLAPDVGEFETETSFFCHEPKLTALTDRTRLISSRKDFCHFEGSQKPVLPNDFWLRTPSPSAALNDMWSRACLVSTLTFLSDVSSLAEDGKFAFKLNGYRVVAGEIANQKVSAPLVAELFKIYRWAYAEGNNADKLGLARNIISLHWKGDAEIDPDSGIYESILSGYTIYLTENVDRYISLKKILCDYLSEFSARSTKLAESIGDKLEKNFVGFVGFFISAVLLKALTAENLAGLFPKPLEIIAWGLIAASLVHCVISFWIAIRERRRMIEDFELLKLRYGDLLHKSDLDRVLGNDRGLRETTRHLDFKLRLFLSGWLSVLLICTIVVVLLSQTTVREKKQPLIQKQVASPLKQEPARGGTPQNGLPRATNALTNATSRVAFPRKTGP